MARRRATEARGEAEPGRYLAAIREHVIALVMSCGGLSVDEFFAVTVGGVLGLDDDVAVGSLCAEIDAAGCDWG